MMTPPDDGAYVSRLINQLWVRDGLHCWRLVVDVQRDLFGRVLPAVIDIAPVGLEGRRLKPKLFAEHAERVRWRDVAAPVHGAIVLMHQASAPAEAIIHAGVYLAIDGGGVLHCDDPQGVAFDTLRELTIRRWSPATYLIPRG